MKSNDGGCQAKADLISDLLNTESDAVDNITYVNEAGHEARSRRVDIVDLGIGTRSIKKGAIERLPELVETVRDQFEAGVAERRVVASGVSCYEQLGLLLRHGNRHPDGLAATN